MTDTMLTPDETRQAHVMRTSFPYRIVYVARKQGEETIVSAVTSMRIPNRLAREGWTVFRVSSRS